MFFSSVPKKTGADLRRFNEKRSLTQAVGVGEKDGMAGRRSFKDLLRERKKKSPRVGWAKFLHQIRQ